MPINNHQLVSWHNISISNRLGTTRARSVGNNGSIATLGTYVNFPSVIARMVPSSKNQCIENAFTLRKQKTNMRHSIQVKTNSFQHFKYNLMWNKKRRFKLQSKIKIKLKITVCIMINVTYNSFVQIISQTALSAQATSALNKLYLYGMKKFAWNVLIMSLQAPDLQDSFTMNRKWDGWVK